MDPFGSQYLSFERSQTAWPNRQDTTGNPQGASVVTDFESDQREVKS